MKLFSLIIVVIFLSSCGTEQHYFKKSLSKSDKEYLIKNDTLTKQFSGKSNAYKQYWNGKLFVRRIAKDFDIMQIGEWRQTSKNGLELYTITNFDNAGYVVDERILGDEGMPPTGEVHCNKETVNGVVRLICKYTNRYSNGQLKEQGQKIIFNDRAKREGKWEYYDEAGALTKVVEYKNDKPVQ
jgi:antitoxin component YwqK of YwqJK toxin-antitoxin module